MKKFSQEQLKAAREEGLILFCLQVQRKYTLPNMKGGSSEVYGALPKHLEPHLRAFLAILNGADPKSIIAELAAPPETKVSNPESEDKWMQRVILRSAPPIDQILSYYRVRIYCHNCGKHDQVCVLKGHKKPEVVECENCGCNTAKT